MAKYLNLPDGTSLEVPDDIDYQTALGLAQQQFPDAFQPPKPPPGALKSGLAGAAVGLGELPLGMAHAAAKGLGIEDTAVQDWRKQLEEWGQEHGTGTFAGKVGQTIGGMAPFALAAPLTGGMSLAAELGLNAATMGIPGAVDAYEAAKKEGASDAEAYEKAGLAAGMGTVAPKIVSGGSKAVGTALKAGEGYLPQIGLAAGEGAVFSGAHTAANKAIEQANARQTEAPWISPEDMAASALGFGALRGAHKFMTPAPPKLEVKPQPAMEPITAPEAVKPPAEVPPPPAAPAEEAPKLPDGSPIPTNPYEVQRMFERSVEALNTAKADAKTAAKAGDMGAFDDADAAAEQHTQIIRALQPHLPAAETAPAVPALTDLLEQQTRLLGGKTADGRKIKGVLNSAIDAQDRPLIKQYREELASLQQQIAETQKANAELQARQMELPAQTVGPEPVNPMAEFQAQQETIDQSRALNAQDMQEKGVDRDVAAMQAARMPTHRTAQMNIEGGTDTTLAKSPTIQDLQRQIAQVPPAAQAQHAELLSRLQDNLPAVAADPARVQDVSDWLHGLRTGRKEVPVADSMLADVGRSRDIAAQLDLLEAGKRSETEQKLSPAQVPLTEEQKALLKGTQNRRNRQETPVMAPTGEVATAQQLEIPSAATAERASAKLTPEQFQQHLSSEGLHRDRLQAGLTVQTMSRALSQVRPIEARIAALEDNAARATEARKTAIETGARGSEQANAALAAAQERIQEQARRLDKELQPLQIQWMETRNNLKDAVERSYDIADAIYKNTGRFEGVSADARDALKDLVNAKGDLVHSMYAPVSKESWDAMRAAQGRIEQLQSFYKSHTEALPAELTRFLDNDTRLNKQLNQAIITEGRLREVHQSARDALDRLARNQQRRKSVQEEKARLDAEHRYRKLMQEAATKAETRTVAEATAESLAANKRLQTEGAEAKAQRESIMAPVLEAQRKRVERPAAPEASQSELEARDAAARKAEQARLEREAALPGRTVEAEGRRTLLNDLADAEAKVRTARNALAGAVTESDKRSAVTQLNEALREEKVLRAAVEQQAAQLADIAKKRVKKEAQIARLEGSDKGGVEEPGIKPETRTSRVNELSKARKALERMRKAEEKVSGYKITEKAPKAEEKVTPETEDARIADAMEKAQDSLERAQHAGNERAVRFYENQIQLLVEGKLPQRTIGPVVRETAHAGNVRTGTAESVAGEMKVGQKRPITQAGHKRGVTAHQAVEEANRVSAELQEKRLKEEAAADKAAAEQARGKKLSPKQQEELQAELDAEMAKESRRAASNPDEARATTDLSTEGREAAEDGRILDLLDDVAKNGATPERRAQAEALKTLVMRSKLEVVDNLMHEGKRVAGLYEPETNTIRLAREGLSQEDFIHEAYHAATDRVLLADEKTLTPTQREARKELERMHTALKNNPNFEGLHATKTVREFVAEVKTNDALREKMGSMGKPLTLWQRFKSAMKRLLKLDDISKADRLIEQIMQPSRTIASAKATAAPSAARTMPADLTAFGSYVRDERTTVDKLKEAKSSAGLAMRQAVADVRASLREALTYGDRKSGDAVSALITQRDSATNNMQAVAEYGAYGFSKDANGNRIIGAGHSASLKDVMERAAELPVSGSFDDKLNLVHDYRVAKRAESVGWDKFDFSDPQSAARDGRALLARIDADHALKTALAAVDTPYNDLNRGMVQFLADTHALPKEVTDAMLADKEYVPFYRANGDSITVLMPDGHPISVGDIRTQPYLKELVGGDKKLLGFTESVMRNISALTSLGLDNLASRQTAYHLQDVAKNTGKMVIQRGKGNAAQDIVRFRQSPDPKVKGDDGWRHIKIDTEGTPLEGIPTHLLVQSIAGTYNTLPSFAKVGAYASDLLRAGVTRNPFYVVRQLLKDSMHASLTGNVDATPIVATMKSLKNFIDIMRDQSPEAATLRKHGVLHSQVFSGGTGDYNKVARMLAGEQRPWWDRAIAAMDRAAMAADAATRTQVYKDIIAKGGSEMEAANAARELMNFNRHGSSSSVQFFSRVIPFFNAGIQGLDLMYRAAAGKMPSNERMNTKQKFFNRAMGMSAMAIAYAMMMEDDPEWSSLTLHQKMGNVMIPSIFGDDGEMMKLPIPFETGMAFFSMPVALVHSMKQDFSAKDWKAVRDVFMAQLPGSGSLMPQMFKGATDVMRNYNSGLGMPIEPAGKQGLDPVQRYTAKTSEAAKAFSQQLNALGVPLSPIQLEYLSNAYLGQLPLMVAEMTDSLFDGVDKVKPAGHLSDSRVWGWLFQSEIGTDASSEAYDKANAIETAQRTFNDMKKSMQFDEARQYRDAHKAELAAASAAGAYKKRMGTIAAEIERIRNMPKTAQLSPEEKQQRIDRLNKAKQEMANQYLQKFRQIEQNVGQSGA